MFVFLFGLSMDYPRSGSGSGRPESSDPLGACTKPRLGGPSSTRTTRRRRRDRRGFRCNGAMLSGLVGSALRREGACANHVGESAPPGCSRGHSPPYGWPWPSVDDPADDVFVPRREDHLSRIPSGDDRPFVPRLRGARVGERKAANITGRACAHVMFATVTLTKPGR